VVQSILAVLLFFLAADSPKANQPQPSFVVGGSIEGLD